MLVKKKKGQMHKMKLVYKDGSSEEFDVDDYTIEELEELFEEIISELHKREYNNLQVDE